MKKLAVLAAVALSTTAFAADHYGTLRGSRITSTNISATTDGSESVFATHAEDNDGGSDYADASHTWMSVSQSQYGINFDGANIEFDFMGNEGQETGGVLKGDSIRVRSLHLISKFGSVDVKFGKMMSQFAGLKPHSAQISDNLIGDTGFIVDALQLGYKINKSMNVSYESTTGSNSGTAGKITHMSGMNHGLRLDWMKGNHSAGFAYKTGTAAFEDAGAGVADADYNAMKVFYSGSFNKLTANFEYYTATNSGNVAGTLGNMSDAAADGDDTTESGYWLSLDYDYGKGNVWLGQSTATLDDAADTGSTYDTVGDMWVGFDYGVEKNTKAFFEYHMVKNTAKADGADELDGTFMEIGLTRTF